MTETLEHVDEFEPQEPLEENASNDQNLWMALGGWTWWSAPSRG